MLITGELGTYHVVIKGEGKVTILLECGMMHTLQQWKYLQHELSKFAKVITYDRLGYGKSGGWTTERTTEQQAYECYDMLTALNISTPLITVGHSLGAYITFLLSRLFPNRVHSMVLLDPTHPTLEENEQKLYDTFLFQFAILMKSANQLKLTKVLPHRLVSKLLKYDTLDIFNTFKSYKHWKTVVSEWKNLYYSNLRVEDALKKKLDIPLLVLTASKQSGLKFSKKKQSDLLKKVEKYHKGYADTSIKGIQDTLVGYTHSSIYGDSEESAKLISGMIKKQIDLLQK